MVAFWPVGLWFGPKANDANFVTEEVEVDAARRFKSRLVQSILLSVFPRLDFEVRKTSFRIGQSPWVDPA